MAIKLKTKKDIEFYESVVQHKKAISDIMYKLADMIRKRADAHDDSKLDSTEFNKWSLNYLPESKRNLDNKEFKKTFEKLGEVREIHYSKNRHHLEFFNGDIKKINIIDLLEIICDWIASTANQDKGNLRLTIERAKERFKFSKEIEHIILNTLELLEIILEVTEL